MVLSFVVLGKADACSAPGRGARCPVLFFRIKKSKSGWRNADVDGTRLRSANPFFRDLTLGVYAGLLRNEDDSIAGAAEILHTVNFYMLKRDGLS